MKTLEQIKELYQSKALDGRTLAGLIAFIPEKDLHHFDFNIKEGCVHESVDFTRENVLAELEKDLEYAFAKALDRRSFSAELMYNIIRTWNWILEEGLEDFDDYEMYGLPLFKATAIKYGFNNPIGDDKGSEYWYCDNYLED